METNPGLPPDRRRRVEFFHAPKISTSEFPKSEPLEEKQEEPNQLPKMDHAKDEEKSPRAHAIIMDAIKDSDLKH